MTERLPTQIRRKMLRPYPLLGADTREEGSVASEAIPTTVLVVGRDGTILEHLGGGDAGPCKPGARGKRLGEIWPDHIAATLRRHIKRCLTTRLSYGHEAAIEKEDGSTRYLEFSTVVQGRERVLLIVRDITDRKAVEAHIEQIAYEDGLTGLPNRQQFLNIFANALAEARLQERRLAALCIDLDHFKKVNDNLGREVADGVLKAFAQRLAKRTRGADCIARLGGDEFTVLLSEVEGTDDAKAAATRILEALGEPFSYGGHEIQVTSSIGISLYPQDGADIETLLQNADTAMYEAKAGGRNNYRLYSGTMNMRSMKRMDLKNELAWALDHDQLELHYQPRLSLHTSEAVAVEALLRWVHPLRGSVPLGEFLPLAEQTGLIVPINDWVLHQACEQAKVWSKELGPFRVSVNLSNRQFARGDFAQGVIAVLEQTALTPSCLELEFTEDMLIRDAKEPSSKLKRLRDMGVGLIVDDFGTGRSSLALLRSLAIDAVKIDRSFINSLQSDADSAAICAAAIAMARKLGITVVAQGVESEAQLDFVREEGCDQLQGFVYCQPLPAGEVLDFLQNRHNEQTIVGVLTALDPSTVAGHL